MHYFSFIILYFSIFSFVGWLIECSYFFIKEKKFINRGFLYGPFVPLYGFGALTVYLISYLLKNQSIFLTIFISWIICIIIEYIGSLLLEKLYSIKLWDYSSEFLNINGRICLKYSLYWLFLIFIQLKFIQPYFEKFILSISEIIKTPLAFTLIGYFIFDFFYSSRSLFRFTRIWNFFEGIKEANFLKLIGKGIPSRVNIKHVIRPFEQFPGLRKTFILRMQNMTNKLKNMKVINEVLTEPNSQKMDDLFKSVAEPIINHPIYMKLKDYKHHDGTIYEHCIAVALTAYKIGLKLNLNLEDIIKGSLFHDFFLYDWRDKYDAPTKYHGLTHPKEAYNNAQKYFGPLSPVVKDIILKHMWPLTPLPPRYFESLLVSFVDKSIASKEMINLIREIIASKLNKKE